MKRTQNIKMCMIPGCCNTTAPEPKNSKAIKCSIKDKVSPYTLCFLYKNTDMLVKLVKNRRTISDKIEQTDTHPMQALPCPHCNNARKVASFISTHTVL